MAWPGNGVGALDPGGLIEIEEGWDFAVLAELARRGHRLAPVDGFARTVFGMGQIILRDPETGILTAGSEPRRRLRRGLVGNRACARPCACRVCNVWINTRVTKCKVAN